MAYLTAVCMETALGNAATVSARQLPRRVHIMSEIANYVRTKQGEAESEGPRPLTREDDASEPYPVEALGTLRQVVEAIAQCSRAPPALCAHAVLAAASLVTQAHADILLPSGQTKPLSLFLLTIAAPGERKRAVDRLAMGAIDAGLESIPS